MSSSRESPSKKDGTSSAKSNIIYSKVSKSRTDKYIGLKITNINDLKKATPKLKLPSILAPAVKKNQAVPDDIKKKLQKYCRACAGIKVPMVDIFSEKGSQMRLLQQIEHLEDIDKDDSLSTQLCMECICDLRASYKLFMQIKKAEMKLRSIYDVLNKDSLLKQAEEAVESEGDSVAETISKGPSKTEKNATTVEGDHSMTDVASDNEGFYNNDSDENFEEFDPENLPVMNESFEKNSTSKQSSSNKSVYQFNDAIKAYVKVEPENESTAVTSPKTSKKVITTKQDGDSTSLASPSQSSKKPNILKRKLSSGSPSDDGINKGKLLDLHKLNLDLRVKIPRLNFEEPMHIKTEEGGVMCITAKGTKPNERLLIKVKKLEKSAEKKSEKSSAKKKETQAVALKPVLQFEKPDPKDSIIDEQIEEYKKKRAQVLGEIANVKESDLEEEPEIRIVYKNETYEEDSVDIKEEDDSSIQLWKESMTPTPPGILARRGRLKQVGQSISQTKLDINRDLSEDSKDRLKAILRQKDEYIDEFVNHLKKRKISVSRLRDEDIISLYEAKNNVVIDRLPPSANADGDADDVSSQNDPFEYFEGFDCDYCFRVFPSRELAFEHEKIHEVKLMHYCDDCKGVFPSHKVKRAHNVTCVQKVMCKFCDLVLDSKGKKRQHEQKHCDEMYGQLCDRCGDKFKHQGTLDQHIKSKHMKLENIFKCPQCPKRFPLRPKLTFHLKSVHTTCRAYLCEDCGSDFKNPASLRHHRIRKHQKVNNKRECPECKKMIPIYGMSKHMHTHKSYSIECQHCDKKFKNTSTLKQHLRIHEDQRQYKCDYCGVGFNRRDGLRLHLKVHEKTSSRSLKECSCQVCGQRFPNHSTLVIHRNREHKDGRHYTCHICNRSMMTTRSLEWHLANIHNEKLPSLLKDSSSIDEETKRVTCLHCKKTFKTEMILRTHVKNTHIERVPMKCSDCEETFTSEVRLKHHMMIQHNHTEGTFECPHEGCPKRFVNHLRLKTHLIAHSEARPHECELCKESFKTRIQLVKHKQNRHSNERPLQCKYCPHTCKQVSALVCHERTHTNERPYTCSICQQKFKYLGDKNKHERRHEECGGEGFKRIVPERDSSNPNGGAKKKKKKKKKSSGDNAAASGKTSAQSSEQGPIIALVHDEGDAQNMDEDEPGVDDMSHFVEVDSIKLESETVASGSPASFDQVYVENASVVATSSEIVGIDNATAYAEEVVADQDEPQIITHEMIDESMLQPGTVVHLQQRDENGKIQLIPLLLSDLSDAEVNLSNASILYRS